MQADRGEVELGGRALVWIPVLLVVLSIEPSIVSAQQSPGGAVAISTGEPNLVRVPPPSSHSAPFNPGAISADKGAGSRGWWLGSSGIALVLAVCGAICVAARKYRPQSSSGLVQV